jgi:hypothetical protein
MGSANKKPAPARGQGGFVGRRVLSLIQDGLHLRRLEDGVLIPLRFRFYSLAPAQLSRTLLLSVVFGLTLTLAWRPLTLVHLTRAP